MVEMEATEVLGLHPRRPKPRPSRKVMLTKGYHLISLAVLVALLVVWNKSPEYAAIGALITTVLTSFLSKDRNEWLTPGKDCGGDD